MNKSQYKIGVLLINLGTPEAPTRQGVKKYLTEFLLDPRVIDIPWLKRQFLVRGAIIPFRLNQSLKSYQTIWKPEGSPLFFHTLNAASHLQKKLGEDFHVAFAMRYQTPSISQEIRNLLALNLQQLIILPLFPQYASATTGSIFEKTFQELKNCITFPRLSLVNQFYNHPLFIEAFKAVSSPYLIENYDHTLFSFHGLPLRQLQKAKENCYATQCYQTAKAIAESRSIAKYTVCFQSRLGKEPWVQPFTSDQIEDLAKKGAKKILVFCPSFVADCLETLYEIGMEYQELFQHAGGEKLDLVPSLNSHPAWIEALERIVKEQVV